MAGTDRVLGVNCGTNRAHFGLVDLKGTVLDEEPRRYPMPEAVSGGERLLIARDFFCAELKRLRPRAVAMLSPTYAQGRAPSWPQSRERATVEILIEVAAAEIGIPVAVVSGRRVRTRLKLATGIPLADALPAYFDLRPAPLYWWEGRAEAAAAAIVHVRETT